MQEPQYISASRRCDLPRFSYRRFFDAWRNGEITYDGGYGREYTVSLRPEHVRGFIFWSKDLGAFIEQTEFAELIRTSNAVFHFTLNDCPDLEPRVAPVERRLETMRRLCGLVGPERVIWRYDPVCAYEQPNGKVALTGHAFFELLPEIAGMGVQRCIFSFMSDYAKLRRRPVRFLEIDTETRIEIASTMLAAAGNEDMGLQNCCNTEIPALVPGISMAHCIDDALLRETDRFGMHESLELKPTRDGCGCYESRDIGSYDPPCPHGCLYCYANPRV
jgi:hypothetical protein